jgi:hypothetical protein
MGEKLRLALSLAPGRGGRIAELPAIHGAGPEGLRLEPDGGEELAADQVAVASTRALPRRVDKLSLRVGWRAEGGIALDPEASESVVYLTMDRPVEGDAKAEAEDGVTVKRMDRAVSWVAPLRSSRPHAIVRALMARFPNYTLRPSPKVPRRYHHPTYFNEVGGAWALSDYEAESAECQAIVRLVRGMLRQLGIPGEARTLAVWADPEIDDGRSAVTAFLEDDPSAGLDRTKVVHGKRWLAALVDAPVEEGEVYPASHTVLRGRKTSPGFNRYEACLEFTHEGTTRDYGGGAGVFRSRAAVLRAFWGLVWVSATQGDSFRVEEIVARYQRGTRAGG